jgi:hypothetical protein
MADENNEAPENETPTEGSPDGTNGDAVQSEFDANVDLFSEYYDESLPAPKQAELKKLIAEDQQYKKAYANFEKTMELLSGMHKMSAPMDFDKKVEGTIHRRSDGRFFGRKAFGDRIPYEILAVLVMLLAGFIYWMGRTSGTGGHRLHNDDAPSLEDRDIDVVPKL